MSRLGAHRHGRVECNQVSQRLDALYKLAFREKNFAALVELQWFITEQVEKERTARTILAKLELVKDDPAALLDLDREFAQRSQIEQPVET